MAQHRNHSAAFTSSVLFPYLEETLAAVESTPGYRHESMTAALLVFIVVRLTAPPKRIVLVVAAPRSGAAIGSI